jgi:hypothetical protein
MSFECLRGCKVVVLTRLLICVLLPECLVGCGKPPLSPAGLPIHAGHNLLQVQGFDASPNPDYPPCQPIAVPQRGKTVWAIVDVQQSGDEWIARPLSTTADSVELHLFGTGSSTLQGQAIGGRLTGAVLDIGTEPYVPPRNVRASFAGSSGSEASDIGGTVNFNGYVSGRIAGSIKVTDVNTGEVGSCSAVQFSLQSYPQ